MQTVKPYRFCLSMPPEYKDKLKELGDYLNLPLAGVMVKAIDELRVAQKHQQMAAAAQLMAEEYRTNSELTAFTCLDGQAFK